MTYNFEPELSRWELIKQDNIDIILKHVPTQIEFKLYYQDITPDYLNARFHGLKEPLALDEFVKIRTEFSRLSRDPIFMPLIIQKDNAKQAAENVIPEMIAPEMITVIEPPTLAHKPTPKSIAKRDGPRKKAPSRH